jgi:hypothetical protein
MTMRNRRILVAAGLIILGVWALSAWFGSTAPAQPTASPGPSPTGAIDSGMTFGPSDVVGPSASAAPTVLPPSGGRSPGGSGNRVGDIGIRYLIVGETRSSVMTAREPASSSPRPAR